MCISLHTHITYQAPISSASVLLSAPRSTELAGSVTIIFWWWSKTAKSSLRYNLSWAMDFRENVTRPTFTSRTVRWSYAYDPATVGSMSAYVFGQPYSTDAYAHIEE